jgi:hypothetical protein
LREHPDMTLCTLNSHRRGGLPAAVSRSLLAVALMMSGSLARAVESPPAAASAAPTAASLMAPITSLVGKAECDNQTQCKVAGIGAKPCGGPDGYIAYSNKSTDVAALRTAVEAQSKAQAMENQKRGLASNCMFAPEPTAVCRPRVGDGKKTCQLGQGGVRSAD